MAEVNFKRRFEYEKKRNPGLVAAWQWDHGDLWRKAQDEGWHRVLLRRLGKEARVVALREYDHGREGAYMIAIPSSLEDEVKADIMNSRRSALQFAKAPPGWGLLATVRLPPSAQDIINDINARQDTWLPDELEHSRQPAGTAPEPRKVFPDRTDAERRRLEAQQSSEGLPDLSEGIGA